MHKSEAMIRIKSPLTKNDNTTLVKKISKDEIIKKYKSYNIDVARYFKEITNIEIYKCNDTGYLFYYPLTISGDSKFYEHFQNFDWYYMPWKWEHEITNKYLKDGLNLLEVGCAHGAFLKKINEKYNLNETVGLELNESSPINNTNWKIVNQCIQDYQKENSNKYDVVCSYQVLEHIADVYGFIEAKIACLKSGGKLIVSVPNNESFIKDSDACLNMPPHHMGLWNTKSLKSLENIFKIKLIKFHYEELQDYHIESYISAKYYMNYKKIIGKIIRKYHKLNGKYERIKKEVIENKHAILGHTILAVYEKI